MYEATELPPRLPEILVLVNGPQFTAVVPKVGGTAPLGAVERSGGAVRKKGAVGGRQSEVEVRSSNVCLTICTQHVQQDESVDDASGSGYRTPLWPSQIRQHMTTKLEIYNFKLVMFRILSYNKDIMEGRQRVLPLNLIWKCFCAKAVLAHACTTLHRSIW